MSVKTFATSLLKKYIKNCVKTFVYGNMVKPILDDIINPVKGGMSDVERLADEEQTGLPHSVL